MERTPTMTTTGSQTPSKKHSKVALPVRSRVHGIMTMMAFQTGQTMIGTAMEL